ncbi:sialidase family protein [Arenibacter latericius]|uniref:sialidase family protein n=1 Tax=Arenibacter latericius TaxID=86104 RepID=UPI000A014978|nr:sialidase family protein [Arenibacter latericius]
MKRQTIIHAKPQHQIKKYIGMKSLFFLCSLILVSCKGKMEKLPEVIPLDHPAIIEQEFIYNLDKALTPECHASTVEVSNGTVVASWFGGTKEKNDDVGIWLSRKTGDTWSTPVEVANGIQDDGSRFPCWNPVLFKPKGQPLMLFYKVGPDPKEWWGLYMTSNDDGKTWSTPTKLPDGVLGPIKNQPIQMANGEIISPSSTESDEDGWQIHLEHSSDSGKTWHRTESLNDGKEFGAIQPVVLNYGNGKLQLLSRTENEVISQNWSNDYGKTWNKMTATELPNPNSGIDGVSLKDGRQLLIYNPTGKNWGDRVPLSLALSTDGKKWNRALDLEPLRENTDKEGEEYSYPTMLLADDGMVHIVYTWNRKTVKYIN